jgi:transposase
MLQSGGRWRDCPREYGPSTTIYNRFNRWATKGRCRSLFEALAKTGKDAVTLSLDSLDDGDEGRSSDGEGWQQDMPMTLRMCST